MNDFERVRIDRRTRGDQTMMRIGSVTFVFSEDEPYSADVCGFKVSREDLDALCRVWLGPGRHRPQATTSVDTQGD